MVLPRELLELGLLLEDVAKCHEVHIPHNAQHQKLVASDTSMVAANSNKELGAEGLQNEDVVECQGVQQKLFQMVEWRFQRSKLVVDTCQRTVARVAWSCNGPHLAEEGDGYIASIVGGAALVILPDCCKRLTSEERTRTCPLVG